jgi:hypothetical protein
MATNAVILLHFGSKKLSITLSDHNLWQVSGDPQQVLLQRGDLLDSACR